MACDPLVPFVVFNGMDTAPGRPTDTEMLALGFTPFANIGVNKFQGNLATNPVRLPRKKNIKRLLCVMGVPNGKNAQTFCLDIEHWLVRDPTSHEKMIKTLQMAHAVKSPGMKIAMYEPVVNMRLGDFAASQGLPGTPQRIEYDQLAALRQPVVDLCDYVAPSLYTYWPDFASWKAFADLVILKNLEIANGKPLYPFLCPRYMPLADPAEGFVPTAMWRQQMEYVWNECDGFILWDYYGRAMTVNDPWWLETLNYMSGIGGGI